MYSLMIVVVTLASCSKMALAQCPCVLISDDPIIIVECSDTSITVIPDCVPSDIYALTISTPSLPLVADTIRRFSSLRTLYIERVDKPEVSKTFLSAHVDITIFGIKLSSLDYIDNEWFMYTPNITLLDFSFNKLTALASDTFSSLPQLWEIFLQRNQLPTLPPTLFEGTSVSYVYLADNPWHCDCELANFMQWVRDHGVTVADQAICLHPVELAGLDLKLLTPDIACKQ